MYPKVVCNCGRSLGHVYPIFDAIRKERQAKLFEETGIRPEFAHTVDMTVKMGDVLDDLGVQRQCCRADLISQVTLEDIY